MRLDAVSIKLYKAVPMRVDPEGVFVILLVCVEVALALYIDNEMIKAAGVVALILMYFMYRLGVSAKSSAAKMFFPKELVLLSLLGIYPLFLGVANQNNLYHLLADVYHWYVEIILVALIVARLVMSSTDQMIRRTIILMGLFSGVIAFFFQLFASLGLMQVVGEKVQTVGIYRMSAGRGYPIIPLLLLLSTFLMREKLTRFEGAMRWVALFLLFLNMVFVLKRVMWLSFFVAVFLIFSKRRAALYVYRSVVLGAILMVFIISVAQEQFLGVVNNVFSFMIYNPNYTIEETLAERISQITGLSEYVKNGVLGYGFGANYHTYDPKLNYWSDVHYVHNAYLFYGLQFGSVMTFVCVVLGLFYLRKSEKVVFAKRASWVYVAAFASLVAALISGLTLISMHTVLFGLVVGVMMGSWRRSAF